MANMLATLIVIDSSYGGDQVKSTPDIWSNKAEAAKQVLEKTTLNSAICSNESPSGQGEADSSKELVQFSEPSGGLIEHERAEPKTAAESAVSSDEGETHKSNESGLTCLPDGSKSTSSASINGTEEITEAISSSLPSQTNEVETAPPFSSAFIPESSTDVETEITSEPESDSPENGEACSRSETEQLSMTPFRSDEADVAPDACQTSVSQSSSSSTDSVCCDGTSVSQPDRSMCSEWCNKESPSEHDNKSFLTSQDTEAAVDIQATCDNQESETINENATLQSAGSLNSWKVNLPASTSCNEKTEGAGDVDISKQFPISLSSCRKTLFLPLLVELCVATVPASSQDAATTCALSNVTETLSQQLLMLLNDSKSCDLSSSGEYFNAFILVYIAALVFLCLARLIIYSPSSLSKAYLAFVAVFPRKETYPETDRYFWSFRWLIGNIKFGHCRSYTSTWLEQSSEDSFAPVIKSNSLTSSGKVHQTSRRGRKNTLHSDGSNTTCCKLFPQLESCFFPTSKSAWFPQLKASWLNAPLLFHVLTCWCAVLPTASHETDANSTLSNVTEILSQQLLIMLWNGSESYQLSDAGELMDPHDTCHDIFVGLLLLCLMSLVFFSAVLVAYRGMYSFARKLQATSKLLVQRIKHDYSRWDICSEACEGIVATNKSTFMPSQGSIPAVGGLEGSRNHTAASLVVSVLSSDNPIEKCTPPLGSADCLAAGVPSKASSGSKSSIHIQTPTPSYHAQPSQESGFYSRTPDPLSQIVTSSADNHDKSEVPPEDLFQDSGGQVLEMPPGTSTVKSSVDFSRSNDIQETATQEDTEVAAAEGCDPSEFVCASPMRKKRICAHSTRGGVQEVTQLNGRTSELAGVTSHTRERARHRHRFQTVNFDEPPPRAQGVSSVETIPVQISPESQLLAFNACVDEFQHSSQDSNILLDAPPDYTPITLGSSIQDGGSVLWYNIALPEAEMPMLQPARCCTRPHMEQGDESSSAPVYPLLPSFRLPSTNSGQHQPLLPSLPAIPSIATQVAYVPVT